MGRLHALLLLGPAERLAAVRRERLERRGRYSVRAAAESALLLLAVSLVLAALVVLLVQLGAF